MIHVCSLAALPESAAALRPARLISIITPEEQPPTPPGLHADAHLRVSCHDIVSASPDEILPDRRHVKQIIAFARQWDPAGKMLVHCQAGISRSTAAALIAYATHFPDSIARAAAHMRRTGPHVYPNRLITALGDELLDLDGRLIAAVEAMGPPSLILEERLVTISHPDTDPAVDASVATPREIDLDQ